MFRTPAPFGLSWWVATLAIAYLVPPVCAQPAPDAAELVSQVKASHAKVQEYLDSRSLTATFKLTNLHLSAHRTIEYRFDGRRDKVRLVTENRESTFSDKATFAGSVSAQVYNPAERSFEVTRGAGDAEYIIRWTHPKDHPSVSEFKGRLGANRAPLLVPVHVADVRLADLISSSGFKAARVERLGQAVRCEFRFVPVKSGDPTDPLAKWQKPAMGWFEVAPARSWCVLGYELNIGGGPALRQTGRAEYSLSDPTQPALTRFRSDLYEGTKPIVSEELEVSRLEECSAGDEEFRLGAFGLGTVAPRSRISTTSWMALLGVGLAAVGIFLRLRAARRGATAS